jgi:hypothetical protein
MLASINETSTTPSESSSTMKDEEVKVDQSTASATKAVGMAKAPESRDDRLEKQDVNDDQLKKLIEAPDSASEKQDHDEDDQDSEKGSNLDTRWERMFTRLLAFKDKYGDCVVPNRYPDDTQLGSWGKKKLPPRMGVVVVVVIFVFLRADLRSVLLTELSPPLL